MAGGIYIIFSTFSFRSIIIRQHVSPLATRTLATKIFHGVLNLYFNIENEKKNSVALLVSLTVTLGRDRKDRKFNVKN